jgi:hypothetical protein
MRTPEDTPRNRIASRLAHLKVGGIFGLAITWIVFIITYLLKFTFPLDFALGIFIAITLAVTLLSYH